MLFFEILLINCFYFKILFFIKSSLISVSIIGSSIVAGILYSSLSAIFLIVPLKTFPDLVFGNLLTTIAILKAATGPTLWKADQRYKENYMSNYEGYYQTYDAGHIDDDGYIWIMSRTDDIINVAGHRLSTGAIEEVLSEHQSVAEWAVLGIADKLKGQLPIGLVVLKSGVDKDNDSISRECVQMVRDKIGPVAAFKVVIVIKRLPKTRSGKILRVTIRKIADGVEYKIPPTIDDPAILTEIKEDLINHKILNNG